MKNLVDILPARGIQLPYRLGRRGGWIAGDVVQPALQAAGPSVQRQNSHAELYSARHAKIVTYVAAHAKALTVRQFFGRKGLLSDWHPNYEFRSGQLEMSEAVQSAVADKKHLIVEAGTGTGKTLAYLVPAILSGRRVVISTGTKNLQEQLFFKDIPFLEKHLGPLRACYMKGRANYACRQKIYDAEKEPVLEGLEEVADFQIIREWEKSTETGDRSEIKTLPEASGAWAKIDARSDRCTGQKCPQFERCFITKMHQKALESDLIIVNHHLFFADLAVKGDADAGGIIPEYGAVIFDEAHEVEEVAGQYFGVSVSSYQFEELLRDVGGLAMRKEFQSRELDRILLTRQRARHAFSCAVQRARWTHRVSLARSVPDEE